MKVAFAHYSTVDDISGVTSWIIPLARRLQADGVTVGMHLHHFGEDPSSSNILPLLMDTGIDIVSVPRGQSLAADVRQTLAFLNSWRPSVFLPQCMPAHFLAAAIAGRRGLPWVFTIHNDDPEYWAVAESLPPHSHGGRTVCVSQHIRSVVIDSGCDTESLVIPCGVRIPSDRVSYQQQPFRVAFCGRIWEHQKRISLVIETLIRTCQQDPAIEAVVIGDGYMRESCEQQVQAAGMSHAITFTGRLPSSAVQQQLQQCQAVLLMSDFEGLPVSLLEAMALGVVPVARAIPSGISELIVHEHTGLLVSDDPQLAADSLCRLATDPLLWHRCSEGARSLVEQHYSDTISYALWRRLIEDLHATSTIHYPIPSSMPLGMRFRLHPLLFHNYRRQHSFRSKAQHRMNTSSALLKHHAKQWLSRI